jgi:WD40 repeat protein
MAQYDRVLIDPSREELGRALEEAVRAANEERRQRLVSWPLPDLEAALNEAAGLAQGWRQWNGGEGRGRAGDARSIVVLAWWSDRIGRKHHRLVGRQGRFNRPMLDNLLCPFGEPRPALWFVYPDYVFLKRDGQRRFACALCACGAFGTPEDLGWMGTCCDACHDLGEDGRVSTHAWPDPRKGTLRGQEGRLFFLSWSPDSRTLAAGTGWERVTLWDTLSGEPRLTFGTEEHNWLLGATWSPDGESVLTCSTDGKVRRWDARTGEELGSFSTGGPAETFAASPDGGTLARSNRSQTALWDVAAGAPRELEDGPGSLTRLAFSADGALLAGGGQDGTVTVWDMASGRVLARLERKGTQVSGLSFSPDGRTLAVALLPGAGPEAEAEGGLLLWDVQRQQVRASLPGHAAGTRCVAFAPDGRVLATGGDDGLMRLWDVASGQERVALEWHLDDVCAVAFSPDGQTVVSGSFDGTAKLWPREALRPLPRVAERNVAG